LIWAAELAQAPRFAAVTPMAAAPAAFLKRRIEMLVKSKREPGVAVSRLILAGLLAAVVAASALAHAAVGDRRITRARAEAAAARAAADALPVELDEALLGALNQAVATPVGRAALERSLERMQAHRTMIADVLAQRGLPGELAAVALMESGFDNEARAPRPAGGAGIWQLIPASARAHGLRVDEGRDERLDPRRETEAAVALLADLHRRFGDWFLAIAAYSRGAAGIEKVMAKSGIRDGRALYRRGLLGGYPAQIQAGVLVLRDPTLVE
jgi:membrane-bound lytic murein transglycosylase D